MVAWGRGMVKNMTFCANVFVYLTIYSLTYVIK